MIRASGNSWRWLRLRLGSGGIARLRILETVRSESPPHTVVEGVRLGFTPVERATFAESHDLPAIAARLPWRGDVKRLEMIAWWGSALGDLASGAAGKHRSAIMREAAAFNLAVALFDSVVEGIPRRAAPVVHALAPDRMRARLHAPDTAATRLTCGSDDADAITRLFDACLVSAGTRFASRPDVLENLSDQLASLYLSEMGLSPDPFIAKSGPVRFIGALSGNADAPCITRLFQQLAVFCQLWDDWQDLEEDLRTVSPNWFLGAPRRHMGFGALRYGFNGLRRVVGGRRLHRGIARELTSTLRGVIDAASQCDLVTHDKSLVLCQELLGERP